MGVFLPLLKEMSQKSTTLKREYPFTTTMAPKTCTRLTEEQMLKPSQGNKPIFSQGNKWCLDWLEKRKINHNKAQ